MLCTVQNELSAIVGIRGTRVGVSLCMLNRNVKVDDILLFEQNFVAPKKFCCSLVIIRVDKSVL